ncbi:hypothetical protein ACVBGC_18860 [Burkholderia stagnalis]
MRIVALSAATGAAMMAIAPAALAQASAPVTSSVFVHQPYDSGNSAINQNFQYIAHPPIQPVAASTPPVPHGGHRGRRGQANTANTTDGGTNNPAAIPLPRMQADTDSNPSASVSQ